MADWFVTSVESSFLGDSAEVFECIDYRNAVRLAHKLAEDLDLTVELLDYEGRVIRAVGFDRFDGGVGYSSAPLRAGVYRWHDASETYREVMR